MFSRLRRPDRLTRTVTGRRGRVSRVNGTRQSQTVGSTIKGFLPPKLRRGLRNPRHIAVLDKRLEELESVLPHAILLEYPTSSANAPRWTASRMNCFVLRALRANQDAYRARLRQFTKYFCQLARIPAVGDEDAPEPAYCNPYFSGLDSVILYGFSHPKAAAPPFDRGEYLGIRVPESVHDGMQLAEDMTPRRERTVADHSCHAIMGREP